MKEHELLIVKKPSGHFVPAYDSDRELARKVKAGTILELKITKARSAKFNRKFRAMIRQVHHLLPEKYDKMYPTDDSLLVAVKVLVGHYDPYFMPDGTVLNVPRSISFRSMDEVEFEKFYSNAFDTCLKVFLPDLQPEEFERHLLNFM